MAGRSAFAWRAINCLAVVLALLPTAVAAADVGGGGVECAHISHQFRCVSDEEQRFLALHVREGLGGKQSVLVVGGFGGSATRAWASIFHRVAPDQLVFARGNTDWDAGYGSGALCE